jgi:hypothetical protein
MAGGLAAVRALIGSMCVWPAWGTSASSTRTTPATYEFRDLCQGALLQTWPLRCDRDQLPPHDLLGSQVISPAPFPRRHAVTGG